MNLGGGASRHCFYGLTPSSQYQISIYTQIQEMEGPSVSITDMTCRYIHMLNSQRKTVKLELQEFWVAYLLYPFSSILQMQTYTHPFCSYFYAHLSNSTSHVLPSSCFFSYLIFSQQICQSPFKSLSPSAPALFCYASGTPLQLSPPHIASFGGVVLSLWEDRSAVAVH